LIRPGGIGDCLLCFPAMEALAQGVEHLEVWTSSDVVPLVRFAEHVQSIPSTGIDRIEFDGRPPDPPLAEHLASFHEIVTWYGSQRPEFREALKQINPRVRFLRALPPPEEQAHVCDYFLQQVDAPPGAAPVLPVEREDGRFAVIHPFSSSNRKNWPLERFQTVARDCECDMPVFWTAGPEEKLEIATRFERLDDLAEWIANASVYIGNDSGITHLAAACGVPTVALFGPTDPGVWGPRGRAVRILHRASLEDIEVHEVLDAIARMLPDGGDAAAGRALGHHAHG
jgi:ADP-heptose:LPS heptosyltransferase